MTRTIFKTLIPLLLLCFSTLKSTGYPVSPQPLRHLVMNSEHIIIGFVIKTYETPVENKRFGPTKAKIAIREELQGRLQQDTIEVEFNAWLTCPAPARYTANTYVLAFIGQNEGGYFTQGLSYGAKTLSENEIGIYANRIKEIQTILKEPDQELLYLKTVEWLVKCCENKVTRWEGLYELFPEGVFMSRFNKEEKEHFSEFLSMSQKARLKQALLATEDLNEDDFSLVDFLYPVFSPEIKAYLIRKLEGLKPQDLGQDINVVYEITSRLALHSLKPEVSEHAKTVNQFENPQENWGEYQKLIGQFIALID